jgi:hypothetical protein
MRGEPPLGEWPAIREVLSGLWPSTGRCDEMFEFDLERNGNRSRDCGALLV